MSTARSSPPPLGAMETVILQMPDVPKAFKLRVAEAGDENLVGKEYHFDRPALIGRADECDIVLPDTSASRRHARIERTSAGFVLSDQKSANGTWVGDRRVDTQILEHLDRFRVGTTVLEFLRDDDATGDDLEMIQTTAIPVREILEQLSIRVSAKPETRLEDEGEAVLVAGNRPFFLDDTSSMWMVESGRIDVFTVAVKDGEPAGARTFFISVEPGQALFGMDLATYGQGNGFLAAGKSGTRLRKIPVERFEELAKQKRHEERIAGMIDTWVTALSRGLVRDLPAGPPIDYDLVLGQEQKLAFQKRARARRGLVWIRSGRSDLIYIGLSAIDGGSALFPVTEDVYVESGSNDELTLSPVATAGSLADPSFWAGLTLFHQVLCECEFLNKKLALVDEFNRLKTKAQQSEAARDAAYADIGAVLATDKKKEAVEIGDVEPVFQACRFVCHALGMAAKKPPETKMERGFEENLALVAIASRFRTRMVALRGDWWAHDQGPLLGKLEATKEPIALLQSSPTSYDWVEPRTGKRKPVTPEFAATLDPFAYVFYRRFPDGMLSAKEVLKFGARDLKKDLMTLITMGCVMGVLGSLAPYFTGRIFDSAIPQAERGLLVQFGVALLVAAIASAAFKLTQSIAVLRIQGKMDYSIQAALWDRLLDLPSTFFKEYSSGDLADRAGGVDAIRQLLAGAGIGAILGSLSSLFYVGLMLSYSIPLAVLGIVLTIVFVAFTTTANYLQLRFQRQQLQMRGKLSGLVLQLISGVAKLRVCGAEHHGFRVWAKDFAEQRRIAFRAGTIQSTVQVFNASFPILSTMAIFAVLVKVQGAAAAGAAGISTGDFIAFSSAYGLFLAAMQALSESSLSLLKAVPIWERLVPILATVPEIDETKAAPPVLKGAIDISHVWFRYSEDTPYILKDVSLSIRPGEYVAFVGGSGSGKSTLMRLMLGFEKPEKGTVSFDGIDLASLDLRLVRQQLGVVLQDSRLLPADVYRNIIGATSRTVDEAWEAAAAAGLDQDVRNMPMGMHTYVPEGGGGFG